MTSRISTMRKRGFLYTLGIAFNRVVPAWLLRMRYFVVFALDAQPRHQAPAETIVCKVAIEERQLIAAERLSWFRRSECSSPLEATLACLPDETVVACCWISADHFDETELGVRIQLRDGQRWLFAAMVDPRFRGQKIFRPLLQFTLEQQMLAGAKELYASVNPTNKSSMKVFSDQSKGIVAKIFAIKLLGAAICVGSGQCRFERRWTLNGRSNPIKIELQ